LFSYPAKRHRTSRRGGTTGALDRRVGLEQEFFLVEESGLPSDRADEFLRACEAGREGTRAGVAPEFVKGLVEVSTPPVYTLAELEREYLDNLRLALRAARSLGIRLYPLGTYPLPVTPTVRDETDYQVQVRTVGSARFVHAGRCAGTHLHLELAEGTVDPSVGVAASAAEEARTQALDLVHQQFDRYGAWLETMDEAGVERRLFLEAGEDERLAGLRAHRLSRGVYPTTEADVLEGYPPKDGRLSAEEGLRLVLEACDELKAQASGISDREGEPADAS
jgi:hypothetical protein